MAILDNTKLDTLFKSFLNKARTSSNKQFFEENIPTSYDVHASEVYLEEIPSIPPAGNTDVVKKYEKIVLTKDKSVSNNLAWVALPTWSNDWSSGSATNISDIYKNFISPKYGTGYIVKVFKGDGTRIPELDATDWIFDYKAGVLTFQNDPGMDGSTEEKSIYIEVYQYIGRTAADGIGSAESKQAIIEVEYKSVIINQLKTKTEMVDDGSDTFIPTEVPDNSVDTVGFTYEQNKKDLMVYYNGILMFPGEDYEEISKTKIEFNFDLEVGDKVVFRKERIEFK